MPNVHACIIFDCECGYWCELSCMHAFIRTRKYIGTVPFRRVHCGLDAPLGLAIHPVVGLISIAATACLHCARNTLSIPTVQLHPRGLSVPSLPHGSRSERLWHSSYHPPLFPAPSPHHHTTTTQMHICVTTSYDPRPSTTRAVSRMSVASRQLI